MANAVNKGKVAQVIGPVVDVSFEGEGSTLPAILNALSVYNIQHCEEPIARWNFMELPRIKKESKIELFLK